MAMSLEQLLAEEGFKGRRLKTISRASTSLQAASEPLYNRHKSSAPTGGRKSERAKSHIPQYHSERTNQTSDRDKSRRPRDHLVRKGSSVVNQNVKRYNPESSEESPDSEIIDAAVSNEIVEIGDENGREYKEVYSNEIYSDDSHSNSEKRESHKLSTTYANSANKLHPGRTSFSHNYKRNSVLAETSTNAKSKMSSLNSKSFDDSRARRKAEIAQAADSPALDDAAIQAIISILSGHIKCFLQDDDFRTLLRHNSFASLNFVGLEEGLDMKSKIVTSLEEAIETVEKAAEGNASMKELKKSSLQLSVITGLNSNDLKDGFTSGIPNFKLAACAHLYLSVIYKLQKKDRIAAKHILQVFSDSPFQARTSLLPDLWDQIFLPNLSHLKVWFIKEVGLLEDTDSKSRNLKILEKVYNETMDSCTNKFALYYKDWLTEGVEPPSFPSVEIPFIPLHSVQHKDPNRTSRIVTGSFSPQPVVSKKLYEEVFRHSNKNGVEVDNYKEESYDGSVTEEIQVITHRSDIVESVDQEIEPDATCHYYNMPTTEETENSIAQDDIPLSKISEIIIKRIAKAFFELHKNEESDDRVASTLFVHFEDDQHPDTMLAKKLLPVQDSCGNDSEGSLSSSIPTEFICPLAGLVFEDPVTLETGQSFERSAISKWFSKGNKTCPVTSKKLECQVVPLSNSILKHVIDKWKSEHWRNLLASSSQLACDSEVVFVLENLLIVLSKDERIENVKWIIYLGGLQFLVKKFNFGNLNEKKSVSFLLSFCIEADSNCRNIVARNIDKMCLLELLCSEELEYVKNAISLMTELICLNRRKDAKLFLSGLQSEDITNIMHQLLNYLKSTPCEQKSLVAVLLLHFHLLTDTQSFSTCIDEAVDTITNALENSFLEERPREMCCKVLLVLGGRFSSSGKIMTEDWILKHAGFIDRFESDLENQEDNEPVNERTEMIDDGEDEAREEWLTKLSATLLGSGKKSFLGALSMCLGSGNTELVRVCLTTVAWLSSVLASLSDSEFELSAFSALICQLKACLEHGELLEHKVLASLCLLNFSKLPECRVLLMMIGEAIEDTLECLAEVTWAARELNAVISSSS